MIPASILNIIFFVSWSPPMLHWYVGVTYPNLMNISLHLIHVFTAHEFVSHSLNYGFGYFLARTHCNEPKTTSVSSRIYFLCQSPNLLKLVGFIVKKINILSIGLGPLISSCNALTTQIIVSLYNLSLALYINDVWKYTISLLCKIYYFI